MKIKITKIIESEQEVLIPFFLKSKEQTYVLACLNQDTIIKIFQLGEHTSIQHSHPSNFASDINTAWSEYVSMSEEEFFEYYQAVLDSISLQPKLVP